MTIQCDRREQGEGIGDVPVAVESARQPYLQDEFSADLVNPRGLAEEASRHGGGGLHDGRVVRLAHVYQCAIAVEDHGIDLGQPVHPAGAREDFSVSDARNIVG